MSVKTLMLFLLFLPFGGYTLVPQSRLELPEAALDVLSLTYPDWHYAEISDETRSTVRQYDPPILQPELVSGDFNGDGKVDYAALISHGAGRRLGTSTLVVFLARGNYYKLFSIEDPDGEYLAISRKGVRSFDFERQQEFTFENDAVDVCIPEKAATSYVYDNGRFRAIITGD